MAQDCQSDGLEGNLISTEIPDPISPWSFLQPSIQPCTQAVFHLKVCLKTHCLEMLCQQSAQTTDM